MAEPRWHHPFLYHKDPGGPQGPSRERPAVNVSSHPLVELIDGTHKGSTLKQPHVQTV